MFLHQTLRILFGFSCVNCKWFASFNGNLELSNEDVALDFPLREVVMIIQTDLAQRNTSGMGDCFTAVGRYYRCHAEKKRLHVLLDRVIESLGVMSCRSGSIVEQQ